MQYFFFSQIKQRKLK